MLPRLPRSTLFPYTTLFRSLECLNILTGKRRLVMIGDDQRRRLQPVDQCVRARDRKSTRLNSSHLGISYAVFCLKKKKKHNKNRLRSQQKLNSATRSESSRN